MNDFPRLALPTIRSLMAQNANHYAPARKMLQDYFDGQPKLLKNNRPMVVKPVPDCPQFEKEVEFVEKKEAEEDGGMSSELNLKAWLTPSLH